MRSALERRQQMLEYLSDHRFTTYSELASKFGISRRTAVRDLEELTCSAPIFTVSGKGGGIRVADGWYISRRYLRDEHESFLRELMDGLQPDQQAKMNEILLAFAKPKVNRSGAQS